MRKTNVRTHIRRTKKGSIRVVNHNRKLNVKYPKTIINNNNKLSRPYNLQKYKTKTEAIRDLHVNKGGDYDEVVDYVEDNW